MFAIADPKNPETLATVAKLPSRTGQKVANLQVWHDFKKEMACWSLFENRVQ